MNDPYAPLVKPTDDSYVPLVIAPATLSYQTDWARVETTSPGVSFRKDEALAGYALYDKVTFTATSVMFSQPHSEVFESGVVPFLIVGDGSPIDITVSKGRDRDCLKDYGGSATVKFGNNSYRNNATEEEDFHNCPLPLTTTFLPRNPGAQPIQLTVNLTNNVYPTSNPNSGGSPASGTTIKLTLLNYLSKEDHLTGDEYSPDMVLTGSPCLIQGRVTSEPIAVAKSLDGPFDKGTGATTGNAGVYQNAASEGSTHIRGAVGYIFPDKNTILVIYFDAVKCRLLIVDNGTVIDSDIVDQAEESDESSVSGSIVLNGQGSNFGAKATSELMPGNIVEMQVKLRNVMTRW
ncbi:hypothetical protein B0H15DRAFT_868222 [Mycena belliarum]|uniref:Uncharacterized protein n=1 Tax=Mycena belliarum TaxID=1033014 RepID=A0AAD6XIZ2_9AGAR|nr:hypothetical protein B0H15DRAFT_868222 [Mycena belliae]